MISVQREWEIFLSYWLLLKDYSSNISLHLSHSEVAVSAGIAICGPLNGLLINSACTLGKKLMTFFWYTSAHYNWKWALKASRQSRVTNGVTITDCNVAEGFFGCFFLVTMKVVWKFCSFLRACTSNLNQIYSLLN